ncbi:MAG: hypothetical protein J0M11_03870 [Anaerolineae bacterium]|nr:hypothetical protein [Anaerolineae bacterium]
MKGKRNDALRDAVLEYFREYHKATNHMPTMQDCADVLGVTRQIVKHYVNGFERQGIMKIVSRRVYFCNGQGEVTDQRKISSAETNAKKAEAGKKVAKMLRTGTSRKGAGTIAERIEAIVNRAKQEGSIYYSRPQVVVLNGEKVG